MSENQTIKIRFLAHNNTSGFMEDKEIRRGQSVGELFSDLYSGRSPQDFDIFVNSEETKASYILNENDRVVINPVKVAGG